MRTRHACAMVKALLAALGAGALQTAAADWPCYQADAARSAATAQKLELPLVRAWVFTPTHPPQPAWPQPGRMLHRQDFDYAFQPAIADGVVYFGSSADDTLRALDVASGSPLWRFTTGGPIRFAPAIAAGKVYVASDDGCLYCLDAKTGALAWRFRAAPTEEQLLGNGRMISRWPLRSGVLVLDGVAYVTAGIWPAQGIYVYALDAATGEQLWCNSSSGSLYIPLPHPGASAFSGVTPDGYLAASAEVLLVPTGRSVPGAFDRRSGRLLYYRPGEFLRDGGSWITVAGDLFFNPRHGGGPDIDVEFGESEPREGDGMCGYSMATGDKLLDLPGRQVVLAADGLLYAAGKGTLEAIDLTGWRQGGRVQDSVKWSVPLPRTYCLALAGDVLLAGGRGAIAAFDRRNGSGLWRDEVDGQVRGLAVSNGRLVAATDKGVLLGYRHDPVRVPITPIAERPTWQGLTAPEPVTAAAVALVRRSEQAAGYALVLGAPDTRLALALALASELHVIDVLPNPAEVPATRERLLATDLYGRRLVVQGLADPATLPYAPYFANLVVVAGEVPGLSGKELYRVLRPCGGVLCLASSLGPAAERLLQEAGVSAAEVQRETDWGLANRGRLPGAGDWRYQWADGGRTGIGEDKLVRLPLEPLWFGGPGPDRMMSRHWGTSTPLAVDGRVFITGQHHLIALDAYNGRELWVRDLRDAGRKGADWCAANTVADQNSLYTVVGGTCFCLDQTTGRTRVVYGMPPVAAKPAAAPPPPPPPGVAVDWPMVWQVIGPLPASTPPLPADQLAAVPTQIAVQGKTYTAQELPAVEGILDFSNLFGGYGLQPLKPGERPVPFPRPGSGYDERSANRVAYAFARITCPQAGKLSIGASADWWMQWYLDGKSLYSTLPDGNDSWPLTITDHTFGTDVTAGDHVLAVMVKSGSQSWTVLSAGGAAYEPYLQLAPPGETQPAWGYLSVAGDLILGSCQPKSTDWANESTVVFALARSDGTLRWTYEARGAVAHPSLAFGDGRLFLVDVTPGADLQRLMRRGQTVRSQATLVALDLNQGTVLWRQDDMPELASEVRYSRNTVVVSANAAYDAATGAKLWQKPKPDGYTTTLIQGDWVIAMPDAYALRTGETRLAAHLLTGQQEPWRFVKAYGCGSIVGCENLLCFRSGAAGFLDLATTATTTFGGVRPNCSVSMIPANGLLLMPEGSAGCTCSYNFQTSLALVPGRARTDPWYVLPGTPIRTAATQVRLNFGAPGDRYDEQGAAWLGFPRPGVPGACPCPCVVQGEPGEPYYQPTDRLAIGDTDRPWLYSSGLRVAGTIRVPLVPPQPVVASACTAAPTLDARLDDPCWTNAVPVPFEGLAHLLAPATALLVCRDAANLYLAYRKDAVMLRGKPVPFAAQQTGNDAQRWNDDDLEFCLTDARRQVGLHFGVSCAGGRFEARRDLTAADAARDLTWNGPWAQAVNRNDREWVAEISLPLDTLAGAGLDTATLQLNAMSQAVAGAPSRRYLADPGGSFDECGAFLPVVATPVPLPERPYTVRLHFAEPDGSAAGARVFRVALQGRTVIEALDLARDVGGPGRALVREFRGVPIADSLAIGLTPVAPPAGPASLPVICALEVVAGEPAP